MKKQLIPVFSRRKSTEQGDGRAESTEAKDGDYVNGLGTVRTENSTHGAGAFRRNRK